VWLEVSRAELVERLRRRRRDERRPDDSEAALARRLEIYDQQAHAVRDALEGRTDLLTIDGEGDNRCIGLVQLGPPFPSRLTRDSVIASGRPAPLADRPRRDQDKCCGARLDRLAMRPNRRHIRTVEEASNG
jgi:hypothetical protein